MPRLSRVPNFSRPFRFRTGNGKTEPSVNDDQAVLLSVPDPSPDADQAQGFPSITSPGNKTPDVTRASATEDKAGKQAEGGQDTDASPDRQNDASALADFDFQFESDPTLLSADLGGINKPIPNFRPHLWKQIDNSRHVLNIDLFWPIKLDELNEDPDDDEVNEDGDTKGVFPFKDLQPLKTFRNLHFLQLNGMMRSYQPIIWGVCWANKNLTILHLEMALEPLFSEDIAHKYPQIDADWTYNPRGAPNGPIEYLGAHGKGVLHEEFGDGEYLDQQAIKASQLDVYKILPIENVRFLPVTHLTLMNFVVDAGPFYRWFDPKKLQEITLKSGCIDAGFYLPQEMRSAVIVKSPKPLAPPRWVKPGEVKLIDIKKKKTPTTGTDVVKAEAKAPEGKGEAKAPEVKADPGGGAGATTATTTTTTPAPAPPGGHGLKNKISHILPRWTQKPKDAKEHHHHHHRRNSEATDAAIEENLKRVGIL
ncbi:hypothetical protein H2204_014330 [Knufia peltigerae]|uniref:Uncharacterized protein n=1 Tax=Knufia peltigerae TaxID=1002370 RepID=A0AA38XJZ5_9EURO|nr:hypothetical protein H2204_014330 [Knufia peltigerae]